MIARFGLIFLLAIVAIANTTNPECQFGLDLANKSRSEPLRTFMGKVRDKIVSLNPDKNVVYSPISIILALALVEAGADGETRAQLKNVLAPAGYTDDISPAFQALQHQLQIKEDNAKVSVANSLFYDNDFTVKQEYVDKVKKCFETAIEKVDFAQADAARQKINTWCANATAQKIPELIKPGIITAQTKAVLANAIYFKAAWHHAFNAIEDHTFYELAKADKGKTVKFMARTGHYKHVGNDNFEMVEIPYADVPISMFIIKPKVPNTSVAAMRSKFQGGQGPFQMWQQASSKNVALKVPRFSIRLPTDLTAILGQVGLTNLFSNTADFSRLDAQNRIRLTNVVHEAFIKVNENGTEAAAATAAVVGRTMAHPPQEPIPFTVDQPFIFTIVHEPTRAFLFAGIVNTIDENVH